MFAECLAALKEHVCCVILHSFYCDIWSEKSAGWFVQETDVHTIRDGQYKLLLYCYYIVNNIFKELISCGTFNLWAPKCKYTV